MAAFGNTYAISVSRLLTDFCTVPLPGFSQMSDFFRKHGPILSEVFWYMERRKNTEENIS